MRYTYPHTIENGHGEQISFVRLVKDPAGDWLEVENLVQPGSGPPMHVHFKQAESLTVVSGRIGVQEFGKEPVEHGRGSTVTFQAGVGQAALLNCGSSTRPVVPCSSGTGTAPRYS